MRHGCRTKLVKEFRSCETQFGRILQSLTFILKVLIDPEIDTMMLAIELAMMGILFETESGKASIAKVLKIDIAVVTGVGTFPMTQSIVLPNGKSENMVLRFDFSSTDLPRLLLMLGNLGIFLAAFL